LLFRSMGAAGDVGVGGGERLTVNHRRYRRSVDDEGHLVGALLDRNDGVEDVHVRASVTAPDRPVLGTLLAAAPEPVERRGREVAAPDGQARARSAGRR